jgi:hypothetical protein
MDNCTKIDHVGACWKEELLSEGGVQDEWKLLPNSDGNHSASRGRFEPDTISMQFNFHTDDFFGLCVDEVPPGLVLVTDVSPTGTFGYKGPSTSALMLGDIIEEVNGQRRTADSIRSALNAVFRFGGRLDIVVLPRPYTFDVSLKRTGAYWSKLGVAVKIDANGRIPRMYVEAVRDEGLVPRWNHANPKQRVCMGDCITHVNRVSRSAEDMYGMIQASHEGQTLELRIETPPRS